MPQRLLLLAFITLAALAALSVALRAWRSRERPGDQGWLDAELLKMAGFHVASAPGRIAWLLERGANPQARWSDPRNRNRGGSVWRGRSEGWTPFMIALAHGNEACLRALLPTADLQARGEDGQGAMCLLAATRHEGIALEAIAGLSDEALRCPLDPKAGAGPVEMAARFGRLSTLRALLDRAPALALANHPNALCEAAMSDHKDCVMELLSRPGPWGELASVEQALARAQESMDTMGFCLAPLQERARALRERESLSLALGDGAPDGERPRPRL